MLRLVVLVLVIANIGFYAWTQGMLDGVIGMRAQGDREPERLARQVRPETIQVLSPAAASAVLAAAAEPATVCLEAGPYTSEQVDTVESVLQALLPPGGWTDIKTERPAVWIVYMGRYLTRETIQKKTDELKRLKVPFEELHNIPELELGLLLGRFDSRAAADNALSELTQHGVRTARVVSFSGPTTSHLLRVERADATAQGRLGSLRTDTLQGKSFSACAPKPS